MKDYLNRLSARDFKMSLPFTLTGRPTARQSAAMRRASLPRESSLAEQAKVDATNAGALQAARDQSAKIDAQIAAGKKAQADYEAAVRATQKRNADIQAENARKQRAFEARDALYRSCLAGDKAACTRYQSGQ